MPSLPQILPFWNWTLDLKKKKKKKGMHFYVVKDNKLILKIVNKKEFSFWINRTIGPRSKVWTEREMIEAAAFEFSEVKNK